MRNILHLNDGWEFTETFDERFPTGAAGDFVTVSLPHSCRETPFHYFDESLYQMDAGYRRRVRLPSDAAGKRVFLVVEAAGHSTRVYVNGHPCGKRHLCGYTAFETEITDSVTPGGEALIAIETDSRETQNLPPFGHVIDYMTYGGLYRQVRLEIREPDYIADVFARPAVSGRLDCDVTTEGNADTVRLSVWLDGIRQCWQEFPVGADLSLTVPHVRLWNLDTPVLYTLVTELMRDGRVVDALSTRIGFREAVFRKDGFYLNGQKTRLLGLNRHQSYPFVGYAMPRSMQRYDADILKRELGLNAVRTSHYPQSRHFIDRCDELGLLVFTEIPGWQHIGNEGWKEIAVENTREIVQQYRNHPSVILWGVRINESADDDDFYRRTNTAAHELDPTRPTGGVRCHRKSSLLEDVYTYNDFFHDGTNAGCEPKKAVTSHMGKPYLISEYNGHMYPTKAFDDEEQRAEQALRHARVLDSVWAEKDIAGCFGWCFSDYNTHRDFGSGDRICYHGVTDMFRNPKLAAAVYAAMQDEIPVLEVSSSMDIGEHPAGNRGRVYLITNADSVRFYKNDLFIREYTHADSDFRHMPRPPVEITDFIGTQIQDNEPFSPKQARYVRDILNESTRFGMNHLSAAAKRKAAWLMLRYRMSFGDAYALYSRYIGNWGGQATVYRFEAVKDGRVVRTVCKAPFESMRLDAVVSHTELIEDETYDVAAVRLRMTDQNGNTLPFFNGAVTAAIEGEADIIGDTTVPLRGGCGGVYIRTRGRSGTVMLTLHAGQAEPVTLTFHVTAVPKEGQHD